MSFHIEQAEKLRSTHPINKRIKRSSNIKSGLSFTVDGVPHVLISEKPITYKIADLQPLNEELMICTMSNCRGGQLSILIHLEDILHNINVAADAVADHTVGLVSAFALCCLLLVEFVMPL